MLDAIYVDTVEEKSIVAIRPKPAFMPLFEVATTREENNVVLVLEKELPPAENLGADMVPCFWWRRGRVELPQQHGIIVLIALGWNNLSINLRTCDALAIATR